MSMTYEELEAASGRAVELYRRLQRLGLINLEGAIYPSILYPPLTKNSPLTAEELWRGFTLPDDGLLSVYVNVPFCLTQCAFCSVPVHTGQTRQQKAAYLEAVEREIDMVGARLGVPRLRTRDMLLGGGTPTDLPPELLDGFLERVLSRLDLSECTQIAVDLDPSTVLGPEGEERLEIMRRHGVKRLAFGVQSLDDAVLQRMGRAHDAGGAAEAVRRSRDRGFKVNVELIFGFAGQTLRSWIETVRRVIALEVDEVQIYRLWLIPYRERESRLPEVHRRNPARFPSVEQTLRMQQACVDLLESSGYRENRRRFYTRTEEDYCHYFHSWTGRLLDQVGFGSPAFNNLRDRSSQNTIDLHDYVETIGRGELPVRTGVVRDEAMQTQWAYILPLRFFHADADIFRRATGRDLHEVFADRAARLVEEGLLERLPNGLRLTPDGVFFVDEVIQQFHHPMYLQFPASAYADGPLNPHRDGGAVLR